MNQVIASPSDVQCPVEALQFLEIVQAPETPMPRRIRPARPTTELLTDEVAATLIAAIRANPTESVPRSALTDRLIELGATPRSAKIHVNRIAREELARRAALVQAETSARNLIEQRERVEGAGARSARLRTQIRSHVGRASQSAIPITVVSGDMAPVLSGEGAYSTFRGKGGRDGGICNNPGAAIRAGYKVNYHRSTWRSPWGPTGWPHNRADSRPLVLRPSPRGDLRAADSRTLTVVPHPRKERVWTCQK